MSPDEQGQWEHANLHTWILKKNPYSSQIIIK